MRFEDTSLAGVVLVRSEPAEDERGHLRRLFCAEAFGDRGLHTEFPQHSASLNLRRGTLRGMHFQRDPHGEVKVVRCTRGELFDAVVDVRPDSRTYGAWFGVRLSEARWESLYIPPGMAHGFVTLRDDTEVEYLISTPYVAKAAAGIRWNDPSVGIEWPLAPVVMSERDASLPLLPL